MSTEKLRTFAALYERKTGLEAEVRGVKAEIAGLREQIMEYFADAGMSSATVDGRTIYLYSQWRPARREDVSAQAVAIALDKAGLGDLTTANWQSLGSYVRELERDDNDAPILPDDLVDVLEMNQTIEPRSRRAS